MRCWPVFCVPRSTTSGFEVVFAGRGCWPGSIEGGGMNHGLLSAPMRISISRRNRFSVHQPVM